MWCLGLLGFGVCLGLGLGGEGGIEWCRVALTLCVRSEEASKVIVTSGFLRAVAPAAFVRKSKVLNLQCVINGGKHDGCYIKFYEPYPRRRNLQYMYHDFFFYTRKRRVAAVKLNS